MTSEMNEMPILRVSGALRPLCLRTDVDVSRILTLTLSGDNAFRLWQSPNPSTTNAPLLVSGQTVTNGVNGISWGTSDAASLYLQTLTNGTATLTYSFIGTGSASGIVCRATMKMTGVEVKFDSMYDTFNPANRIFNPTPKDDPPEIPTNKLYLVESPDMGCYQASLEISCRPPDLVSKLVAAVYYDGEKIEGTDTLFLPDGKATLLFNDAGSSAGITDYPVKVGLDGNGNNLLDAAEVFPDFMVKHSETGAVVGPPVIRGTSAGQHEASLSKIDGIANGALTAPGWATSAMIPHAKALLLIFLQGNTAGTLGYAPTDTSTVLLDTFAPVSGFSEWLTHNSGASFNADGTAEIKEYVWSGINTFGDLAMTSAAMKQSVMDYYISSIMPVALSSLVPGQSAWFPVSAQGVDIPHASESPDWVPGATLEMDSLLPNIVDDLNGTFGRIRIVSHKARFRIGMETVFGEDVLVVEETQTWGELQDLYDFNHDVGGVARDAAILQIGHGNGSHGAARANGVIYRTKVLFDKTYQGLP